MGEQGRGESCCSVGCVYSARNDGRVRLCGMFFHSNLIKHMHRINPRAASAGPGKVLGQQVPVQGGGQLTGAEGQAGSGSSGQGLMAQGCH